MIFVDDNYGLSIKSLRDKLTRLLSELEKIDLIIIDNLQHISANPKSENRQIEISQISRGLKAIAKEFDLPIMILCQLPSKSESVMWHRPTLSDLEQIGSIGEIADFNIIIHREEVYRSTEENQGLTQIGITKVQNGSTHNINLVFLKEFDKFENYFSEI